MRHSEDGCMMWQLLLCVVISWRHTKDLGEILLNSCLPPAPAVCCVWVKVRDGGEGEGPHSGCKHRSSAEHCAKPGNKSGVVCESNNQEQYLLSNPDATEPEVPCFHSLHYLA